MPRTENPDFKTHLESQAITTCHCVKIVTSDNAITALTQHDKDVVVDGVTYLANVGFTPSAVKLVVGLSIDNAELNSAINLSLFTHTQIDTGYLDEAEVTLLLVNWSNPSQYYTLVKGVLGQITKDRNEFKAELRSAKDSLKKNVGRTYSSVCDALLGDARCGKDISSSTFTASSVPVDVVANNIQITVNSALSAYANRWFNNGLLTFTSGDLAGQSYSVRYATKAGNKFTIELWQKPYSSITVGDTFSLVVGCDKQFATCVTRFQNGVNFRGFPYIPTPDRATSYLSQSRGPFTGGSIYR